MPCEAHLSLIVSANWVHPQKKSGNRNSHKFSPKDLFCGTFDRTKSSGEFNSRGSLRRSSKRSSFQRNSTNTSSSRYSIPAFFDLSARSSSHSDLTTNTKDSEKSSVYRRRKNVENSNNSRVMDPPSSSSSSLSSVSGSKQKQQKSQASALGVSVSSPNLRKDTHNTSTTADKKELQYFNDENGPFQSKRSTTNGSGIHRNNKDTTDNSISLDNEDYAKYVESYERNLEKQHHEVKQPNIPNSILKQPKKATDTLSSLTSTSSIVATSTTSSSAASGAKKKTALSQNNNSAPATAIAIPVRPNTIMSLEDRDIVVIDRADINESTRESEVIVLEQPRSASALATPAKKEMDLAEILGPNWPDAAGSAAQVLNNEMPIKSNGTPYLSSSSNSSTSSYQVRPPNERIKSINPFSHIMPGKVSDKRIAKNHVSETLINFDSNGTVLTGTKKKQNEPFYDNTQALPPPSYTSDDEIIPPSPLSEIPGTHLGVGSMVEVSTDVCEDLYGVIRWIGNSNSNASNKNIMVGVELEDDQVDKLLDLTDGTLNGVRMFRCPLGRALFIHPSQCAKDRRFSEAELHNVAAVQNKVQPTMDSKMFGHMDCPVVPGAVPPLKILQLEDLEAICGKFKGIQGHHNSCYLDATLFSMFTFTGVFDSLLFRPPEPEDNPHYEEVQKVLREEIVNPLRKNIFVRADRVMKLRQLLERLSSVTGLTCEEKDPEEFLNSLLAQIMRADPFLKLSSGQDAFYYQLFVEKDERLSFPSVQQLFEQSFLASDIKLREVPSCLIIQMPRFGKNFKMYPRILPSQVLDVTDIIEDSPRQCSVCGKLAEFECKECFGMLQCGVGLESTAFCKKCLETVHSHAKRANHSPREISVPPDFKIMAEHLNVPRLFMELFAVVCIETSHYVAFVKAGSGLDAPWCFFDSMADRKGEQNGYNIPEMVSVPDLPQWLSEDGAKILHEAATHDKLLPEHAKRLLCDAYMCMYQSTDVMMYR